MADILEVLMALQNEFGLDPKDVENLRQKKSDKKGGFTKGYIIPI
jgi:predicted house-cleaning noncanonical NTP pyrophosphatase (MazG superfamily)